MICIGGLLTSVKAETHHLQYRSEYKAKQQDCIIEALWKEARGTSKSEIQRVATVIQNRKDKSNYSYCALIHQKNQFTFDKNSKIKVNLESSLYYLWILEISQTMVNGTFEKSKEIKNAMYFHNYTVLPNWDYSKIKLAYSSNWHNYYH